MTAAVVAPVLAGLAAVGVVLAGWQGADWPAQVFRIEMFRADGFTLWNNHWYGGHHSVGYSVLLPALAAVLGGPAVAVGSTVVATGAIGALLRRVRPDPVAAAVGSSLCGLGLVANVAVGRLPFLLGVAVGLVALLCWTARHPALAASFGVATGLASPVAALFLAMVAVGISAPSWRAPVDVLRVGDVRGQGPLIASVAMGPVLALAVLFPSGGSFPFAAGGWVLSVLALAGVCLCTTRHDRQIRAVLALAGVALVAAWAIPTPLGGNMVRLPMFFALPVITVLAWRSARLVRAVATVALLVWAWSAAGDAVLRAGDDPTLDAAFFAPMIEVVSAEADDLARVEIPFTRRHWEAAHVAPVLPLARGWERQLDRRVNPVFYGSDPLDALDYHTWLQDNAVRFVALPDVDLDPSAEEEAALLEQGQPYLRPVWESEDWQVWEVLNSGSLVGRGAELVAMEADRIVVDVARPGEVLVRVRFSPHWAVDGPGCVRESTDGWTLLDAQRPGRHELVISPAALAAVGSATADPCVPDAVDDGR